MRCVRDFPKGITSITFFVFSSLCPGREKYKPPKEKIPDPMAKYIITSPFSLHSLLLSSPINKTMKWFPAWKIWTAFRRLFIKKKKKYSRCKISRPSNHQAFWKMSGGNEPMGDEWLFFPSSLGCCCCCWRCNGKMSSGSIDVHQAVEPGERMEW